MTITDGKKHRNNFLIQAQEAERMQARDDIEMKMRIKAARRYIRGNILQGLVVQIDDSVDLILREQPYPVHPVHFAVLRHILFGAREKAL